MNKQNRIKFGLLSNISFIAFIFATNLICASCVFASDKDISPAIKSAINMRLKQPGLRDAILGILAFLDDRQIRNRKGKLSSEYDSSYEGEGCKNVMSLNMPFRENLCLPAPKFVKAGNRTGEWASYVHFMPNKIGFKGRAPLAVQDSNLFMTAFIAYPLYMFDESKLAKSNRYVDKMLKSAMDNVLSFKRGTSYNFWAVLPGTKNSAPRTGPFNIAVSQLEMLAKAYINPKFEKIFALLAKGQQTPPKYWLEACLDLKANPTGADALFNIPNDADDTSTAVAFEALYAKRFPNSGVKVDLNALAEISEYRDLNRTKEDGRDGWKGRQTGAYLTWMKDENKPTFDNPEQGIIPLGKNNIDIVVNSNVLFALGFTKSHTLPGYKDCIKLVANAIKQHAWPEAGLYYPQNIIFPYSVTRAWKDGGVRHGEMRVAMKKLMKDLLKEQWRWGNKHSRRKGAFPGGDDKSDHLATALGVTSLINIGREIAVEENMEREYDYSIRSGIAYLLKECKWKKPKNKSTIGRFASPKGKCATWESGLFFAASFWDLAHWRSQAFTGAMVLEAFTKYALAYDLDNAQIGDRKLKLRK